MNETKELKVSNRRISKRRHARGASRVECRKGALGMGKDIGHGLLDVSEDGIRLTVREELPLNSEVEIVLHPVSGKAMKRLGHVMWVLAVEGGKQFCAGVRFDKRLTYAEVGSLSR